MDQDNFSIEKDKINKIPDKNASGNEAIENFSEKDNETEKGGANLEKIIRPEFDNNFPKMEQDSALPAGNIISAGREKREREERIKAIEKTLEEDLDDIYLAMPEDKRAIFRVEGERACAKINELIEKGALTLKKAVFLIKQWLSYIPGVNKTFLEQEAKIKADEIMTFSIKKYGKSR